MVNVHFLTFQLQVSKTHLHTDNAPFTSLVVHHTQTVSTLSVTFVALHGLDILILCTVRS